MNLKITLLISCVTFFHLTSNSQNCQIFNGNMEAWERIIYPPSIFSEDTVIQETPSGWLDILGIFEAAFGEQPSAGATSDAFEGDSALKITALEDGGGSILFQKIACGSRPISLNAALKHLGAESIDDTIAVAILLGNEFEYGDSDEYVYEVDTVNSIGYAVIEITGEINTYTEFTMPIKYLTNEIPDSMLVLVYSSNNGLNGITEAFFDAISLDYKPLSVEDKFSKIRLYPNPVSDIIFLEGELNGVTHIIIYSAEGEQILTPTSIENGINVSGLKSGVYVLEIKSNQDTYHYRIIKD